jgi:hypothetical protein
MAWFRKKEPEVIRRGSSDVTEERKSVRFGGQKVEVRRVTEVARPPEKSRDRSRSAQTDRGRLNRGGRDGRSRVDRPGLQTSRGGRERPLDDEIIIPTDVGRKQMLVRVLPHQTQVVVLEVPVLVEHYVAGQDRRSATSI